VKVIVERSSENRELVWEVESPEYYRASTVQLDGEASPKVWVFRVRDLPQGQFDVRATVRRNDNKESFAQTKLIVMVGGGG
jgi:hypothetical protein